MGMVCNHNAAQERGNGIIAIEKSVCIGGYGTRIPNYLKERVICQDDSQGKQN